MITLTEAQANSYGIQDIKSWYRIRPIPFGADYVINDEVLDDLIDFHNNGDAGAWGNFMELNTIFTPLIEDDDIIYRYDSKLHIDYSRGDSQFGYNNGVLMLSLDGGDTFPYHIAFEDCDNIGMSYIFANGNIVFATKEHIYLSKDNLTSYSEITVKDLDGSDWTPIGNGDNFRMLGCDAPVIISETEYLVFGNYGNTPGQTNQANIYATDDSGETINIVYRFDVAIGTLDARHIHVINYNQYDGYFYCQTGDYPLQCHWIKAHYTDLTTWSVVASGDDDDYWKTAGMGFNETHAYWVSDVTDDINKRMYFRVAIADIADSAEYELIYDSDALGVGIALTSDNEVVISGLIGASNTLYLSKDAGATMLVKTINEVPDSSKFLRMNHKNRDGFFRTDIAVLTSDSFSNGTFWIKIK